MPTGVYERTTPPWNKGLTKAEDSRLDYERPTKFKKGNKVNLGRRPSKETLEKLLLANTGRKQSKETIEKRVASLRGVPRSEAVRKKISEAHKAGYASGEIVSWIKGKHHSEETKRKMSEAHKGKKLSEEHKKKISETKKTRYASGTPWNKGLTKETDSRVKRMSESHKRENLSDETRRKMSDAQKGKIVSEETRRKISEANKGEKSHNWRGGTSFEPYSPEWTPALRRSIRERDGCCMFPECGTTERLVTHHINYNKMNCDPSNLMTLCVSHNSKVNFNREYWEEYFNGSCTKPRSSLRLVDVVVNLLKRGRVEEAIDLQIDAVILAVTNSLNTEDVMRMPIKDMVALSSPLPIPYMPQVEGWDKIWYGEGAFERHDR